MGIMWSTLAIICVGATLSGTYCTWKD